MSLPVLRMCPACSIAHPEFKEFCITVQFSNGFFSRACVPCGAVFRVRSRRACAVAASPPAESTGRLESSRLRPSTPSITMTTSWSPPPAQAKNWHRGTRGSRTRTDLAVLRVKEFEDPYRASKRTDTGYTVPENLVVAIGRNKESTNASLGVLSRPGRPVSRARGGKLDQVIRVDLDLHPASSGGAVVEHGGASQSVLRHQPFPGSPCSPFPAQRWIALSPRCLRTAESGKDTLGAGLTTSRSSRASNKKPGGINTASGLIAASVDQDGPAGQSGANDWRRRSCR